MILYITISPDAVGNPSGVRVRAIEELHGALRLGVVEEEEEEVKGGEEDEAVDREPEADNRICGCV